MSWWDSTLNLFTGGLYGDAKGGTAAVTDGIHVAEAIWVNLSDFRMWRSLGWLLLGVLLLVLGFLVWNRRSIAAAVETASKVAAI